MRRFRELVGRMPIQCKPRRWAALLGLLWCASVLLVGAPASASTAISGDMDTNAPLEIDPSTAPTNPRTITRDLASGPTVGFIQRMPVTKRVTQVTIGDLGGDESGCGETMVRLWVQQHNTGDVQSGADMESFSGLTYSAYQPLPSTPGKVTWTIPTTTFHKGRGYSFYLNRQGSCRYARQITWDHEEAKVNSGPAACTGGPRPEPKGTPVQRRMWHQQGENDWSCTSAIFNPGMPSGWLMVQSGGSGHVRAGSAFPYWPTPTDLCGATAANAGATVEYWRPNPTYPQYDDYVCMWPQYGPPNDTTSLEDGWYYGIPWLNDGTGQPRDSYLKLETIDYGALLETYEPRLLFDSTDPYRTLSAGAATDLYDPAGDTDDGQQLSDPLGDLATANPALAGSSELGSPGVLSLSLLGPTYDLPSGNRRDNTVAGELDFLDLRGTDEGDGSSPGFISDSVSLQHNSNYADRIYARAAHGEDGKLWLQYWFFYYYDPQTNFFGTSDHEGDWEMVQVGLDSSNQADEAVYAQHGGGERCLWGSVEKANSHPAVYVARESHASFFTDGFHQAGGNEDTADGFGISPPDFDSQPLALESSSWVGWPGAWGASDGDSPPGPRYNSGGERWNDPSGWRSGSAIRSCDAP